MFDAHKSAERMARSLVTYKSCAHEVRKIILGEFDSAPTVRAIAAMRGGYLRQVAQMKRGKREGKNEAYAVAPYQRDESVERGSDALRDAILRARATP